MANNSEKQYLEEQCCGKGCIRSPTKVLKIRYVGKIGRFCESCAADLLNAGLIDEGCTREGSLFNS